MDDPPFFSKSRKEQLNHMNLYCKGSKEVSDPNFLRNAPLWKEKQSSWGLRLARRVEWLKRIELKSERGASLILNNWTKNYLWPGAIV